MRILFACEKASNPYAAAGMALVPDLEALGHRVIRVDQHAYAALYGHEGAQRLLVEYVRAYRPHVVITNPPYDLLAPETCDAIQALGVPIIGWRYDDAIHIGPALKRQKKDERLHLLIEQPRKFTLNATTSRLACHAMQEAGTPNVAYVRFAVSEAAVAGAGTMDPVAVSFLGQPYWENARQTRRIEVIRQLAGDGVPVALWGGKWQSIPDLAPLHRGVCPRGHVGALFRQSAINLAVNGWVHSMPKMRTFEIALAGGFQLADDCEELGDYFKIGDELITTTSYDDLRRKIDYYLAHPDERQRLAAAGHARMRREHTWRSRWPEMLAALEAHRGRPIIDDDDPGFIDDRYVATLLIAQLGAGHVAEAAGAPWEAEFYYRSALDLSPGDYGALAGLGRLALKADDPRAGYEYWTKAAKRYPPYGFVSRDETAHLGLPGWGTLAPKDPHAEAVMRLFELALQQDDWASVLALLDRAAGAEPMRLAKLAFALLDKDDVEKANAVACALLSQNEADPNALRCLVEYHAKLGDFPAARRYLQAFQTAMPGHPDGQRMALGLWALEKEQGP